MTTPPDPVPSWQLNEFPVCSGQGWTGSILWLPMPDHTYVEQPDSTPLTCYCGFAAADHDPASPQFAGRRVAAIRVLNLTGARHRMTIGDAKTLNEEAWVSPWIEPGDDRDYGAPDMRFSTGANIYFTDADQPYRVSCT